MPQHTFTPNAPKIVNWPMIILIGFGVIIILGVAFMLLFNKSDIRENTGIDRSSENSQSQFPGFGTGENDWRSAVFGEESNQETESNSNEEANNFDESGINSEQGNIEVSSNTNSNNTIRATILFDGKEQVFSLGEKKALLANNSIYGVIPGENLRKLYNVTFRLIFDVKSDQDAKFVIFEIDGAGTAPMYIGMTSTPQQRPSITLLRVEGIKIRTTDFPSRNENLGTGCSVAWQSPRATGQPPTFDATTCCSGLEMQSDTAVRSSAGGQPWYIVGMPLCLPPCPVGTSRQIDGSCAPDIFAIGERVKAWPGVNAITGVFQSPSLSAGQVTYPTLINGVTAYCDQSVNRLGTVIGGPVQARGIIPGTPITTGTVPWWQIKWDPNPNFTPNPTFECSGWSMGSYLAKTSGVVDPYAVLPPITSITLVGNAASGNQQFRINSSALKPGYNVAFAITSSINPSGKTAGGTLSSITSDGSSGIVVLEYGGRLDSGTWSVRVTDPATYKTSPWYIFAWTGAGTGTGTGTGIGTGPTGPLRISVGTRVQAYAASDVYSQPSSLSSKVGYVALTGATPVGTVIEGPVKTAQSNGASLIWAKVDFDSFPDGWVIRNQLTPLGSAPLPASFSCPASARISPQNYNAMIDDFAQEIAKLYWSYPDEWPGGRYGGGYLGEAVVWAAVTKCIGATYANTYGSPIGQRLGVVLNSDNPFSMEKPENWAIGKVIELPVDTARGKIVAGPVVDRFGYNTWQVDFETGIDGFETRIDSWITQPRTAINPGVGFRSSNTGVCPIVPPPGPVTMVPYSCPNPAYNLVQYRTVTSVGGTAGWSY